MNSNLKGYKKKISQVYDFLMEIRSFRYEEEMKKKFYNIMKFILCYGSNIWLTNQRMATKRFEFSLKYLLGPLNEVWVIVDDVNILRFCVGTLKVFEFLGFNRVHPRVLTCK